MIPHTLNVSSFPVTPMVAARALSAAHLRATRSAGEHWLQRVEEGVLAAVCVWDGGWGRVNACMYACMYMYVHSYNHHTLLLHPCPN